MIDPYDWPNPPLQIVDADYTQLPTYDPYLDGPRRPPWVIRVIECWAWGYIPIATNWHHVHNPGSYWPAFDLDGIEWMWRNDGAGVWTLVQLLDADLEQEEFEIGDPRGRVRDF
ncbi:hypothetical protein [Salipiger bermudensis]|uniref:hypothetical protein n=1 Tax=Salipiger bermudensis TaxID=344736 RepID=UPI001CD5E155|nr:hypothetical protein [Salipiger bermudensis]MCA0961963.1 hypothetical protein [Salipiger bermudensis]